MPQNNNCQHIRSFYQKGGEIDQEMKRNKSADLSQLQMEPKYKQILDLKYESATKKTCWFNILDMQIILSPPLCTI